MLYIDVSCGRYYKLVFVHCSLTMIDEQNKIYIYKPYVELDKKLAFVRISHLYSVWKIISLQ